MKILIAAHKKYKVPTSNIYLPVQVGATLADISLQGFAPDDSGTNISALNPYYNELTALYWAKYNLVDEDVIGLVHYRRYFGKRRSHDILDILSEDDIYSALDKFDVILPKQRNYFIENQERHYLNAHENAPYFAMVDVIAEYYPEYLSALEKTAKSTKAHLFNMSIMKQADFQAYTDFLFGVLGKVSERVELAAYTGHDQRALGFLGERLMDVWVSTNQKSFKEFPVVSLEKVNWFDKGFHFLKRKFFHGSSKKVHF
jgi:hypothetical protein